MLNVTMAGTNGEQFTPLDVRKSGKLFNVARTTTSWQRWTRRRSVKKCECYARNTPTVYNNVEIGHRISTRHERMLEM